VIQPVASSEVSQNMAEQTDLDSMYFSGKAQVAIIVYTISKLTHDPDLATAGLLNLKDALPASRTIVRYILLSTTLHGKAWSAGRLVTGDPNQFWEYLL
jgi:endo-1,3(4)-beta-glucanase